MFKKFGDGSYIFTGGSSNPGRINSKFQFFEVCNCKWNNLFDYSSHKFKLISRSRKIIFCEEMTNHEELETKKPATILERSCWLTKNRKQVLAFRVVRRKGFKKGVSRKMTGGPPWVFYFIFAMFSQLWGRKVLILNKNCIVEVLKRSSHPTNIFEIFSLNL